MRKFRRKGSVLTAQVDPYEVQLLVSLVGQLVEVVDPGEPEPAAESSDPFERWAAELDTPGETAPPEDPVLLRLFPDAYRDEAAAADFRRFTERDLRATKLAEADIVLRRLQGVEYDLRIPVSEVEPWLRTLTALRLAVGTRLGITDAESAEELVDLPAEDPRAYLASIYDWLGFAQETMLGAL